MKDLRKRSSLCTKVQQRNNKDWCNESTANYNFVNIGKNARDSFGNINVSAQKRQLKVFFCHGTFPSTSHTSETRRH